MTSEAASKRGVPSSMMIQEGAAQFKGRAVWRLIFVACPLVWAFMISFLSSLAFTFPTSAEILEAIPVILSLIIIEGLLSVDNALAIAALAKHLPRKEKFKALRYGIIGAYVFRGLCMWGAAWIIDHQWVKILGSAYLIHLMASHFSSQQEKEENPQAEGDGVQRGFWATILAIEFMDLTLSVDNVVAAVAISPDKLWVVCTGVFIGILALRFLAGYCIRLIEKFPMLENTAFLLIGYVGLLLLAELAFHFHLGTLGKFVGICNHPRSVHPVWRKGNAAED